MPEAYDYGPERVAWVAVLLTNWIGDEGFLSELYCEVRRFNLIGDLTCCRGKVVSKDEREGKVKLDVECVDQRGDQTASGWAIVTLPRRNG